MKKIIVIALMLAPLSVCAQKFAHFNMGDIMPNLPEYQTASADLQKLGTQYQEELERLQKEYTAKAEEYQRLAEENTTAQAILQSKFQDIQKMEQSIQDFYQASQQDMQQQQAQKMELIQEKIMKAIAKIADQGNYVYVMDLSGTNTLGTPVSYVNNALSTDITAQLKQALGI